MWAIPNSFFSETKPSPLFFESTEGYCEEKRRNVSNKFYWA